MRYITEKLERDMRAEVTPSDINQSAGQKPGAVETGLESTTGRSKLQPPSQTKFPKAANVKEGNKTEEAQQAHHSH